MTKHVVIIDYMVGNLLSVYRAFDTLDVKVTISRNSNEIRDCDFLVLPGVGAFRDGMISIRESSVLDDIIAHASTGKPLLGICLGMQMLLSRSYEFGLHDGLNLIPGEVVPIPPGDSNSYRKIPHIGWVSLSPSSNSIGSKPSFSTLGINNNSFYFVHSFALESKNTNQIIASTNYNQKIPAIIGRDNYIGVQFHPEKSGNSGQKFIYNWLKWCP